VIIYQGVLNVGRGLENMISAMKHLDDFQLQIFGGGDIEDRLKQLSRDLGVEARVNFMGRIPFGQLRAYTRQASLGISLEEERGLNYRFALPNKLFDYVQAGIPVLVSGLPEMRRIVEEYGIGQILDDPEPQNLARQIREMMGSDEWRMQWKKNLSKAAAELCWEKEEQKFIDLCARALEG
jgi:glycosyltransferase involved in cell wall biosynthesis